MIKKSLIAATMVALSGLGVQADTFNERVDTIFQNLIADDEPGCSVGVVESGHWMFHKSYGLASMEFDVPMTTNSVHNLASVSKQFTAMAVHLLADEGKIDLNEDISTYLPGLKDYGERVTINAMLGHVSGMANFTDYDYLVSQPGGEALTLTTAIGGPYRFEDEEYISTEDLYAFIKRLPLRYSPNERFHYSNVAYFLLSMLVEEVSGQSLADYSELKIFQPLGMTDTLFVDSPLPVIDNLATGYDKLRGRYVRQDGNYYWVGDSRLHTTLNDLLIWDRHFYNPRLVS
jgi:CubicO group peptidase (beta-lactamase class C family)